MLVDGDQKKRSYKTHSHRISMYHERENEKHAGLKGFGERPLPRLAAAYGQVHTDSSALPNGFSFSTRPLNDLSRYIIYRNTPVDYNRIVHPSGSEPPYHRSWASGPPLYHLSWTVVLLRVGRPARARQPRAAVRPAAVVPAPPAWVRMMDHCG